VDERHLDEMFDRFRAGPPLARAAGAEAAKQAFRHRRRGRLAAGCVLAAAAVGVPSVAVATGEFDRTPKPPVVTTAPTTPDRSAPPTTPSTTRPASPSSPSKPVEPSGVPRAAMLDATDLPAGYRYRGDDLSDADWTLAFVASTCMGDRRLLDTEPLSVAKRDAAFGRGREESALQRVYRMPTPGVAKDWIDGLPDRVSGDCGRVRFVVVDTDFAGADSVLLRYDLDEGGSGFVVFVRQGPLLTQIAPPEETVAAMRDLARAAAQRLCAGTTAC
jgi:hypothetical protein